MTSRALLLAVIAGFALIARPAMSQWKQVLSLKDDSGLDFVKFLNLPGAPRVGYCGGRYLWKTVDGGNTWRKVDSSCRTIHGGGYHDLVFKDSLIGWVAVVTLDGVCCLRTVDGGETWSPLSYKNQPGEGAFGIAYSNSSNRLFLTVNAQDSFAIFSDDHGQTWQHFPFYNALYSFSSDQNGLAIALQGIWYDASGGTHFLDSNLRTLVTNDGGVNWRETVGNFGSNPYAVPATTVCFLRGNTSASQILYRSLDYGIHWDSIYDFGVDTGEALNHPPVGTVGGELSKLYIQTAKECTFFCADSGLYYSTDTGRTWFHEPGSPSGYWNLYAGHGVVAAIKDSMVPGINYGSSLWLKVEHPNGVQANTSREYFWIHPNPTHDRITLDLEAPAAYEIRDMLGAVRLRGRAEAAKATLDVSLLPAGVYYISSGSTRARFVKE